MSEMDPRLGRARPRILLVDDTELNRDLIGRVLMEAGFDVDLAADGEEAVAATWSKAYDLVLMDIEMPGMNGFEAAARIRAREGVMSGVKIVALTATRQPDAEQISFWSGIDEFIAKPIQARPLVARVHELVAEGARDSNDWRPVWRLAVFAKITDRLDVGDAAGYLDEFAALLDAAAAAVDEKRTFASAFHRTTDDLLDMARMLGFEEIAGLCATYRAERGLVDMRCRDPNLYGAIARARYAIQVYQREQTPASLADWWAKARVTVQSLFRGREMAGAATY